jgi:hypothetical protein
MNFVNTIQLHPVLEFAPYVGNGELLAVNAGPSGQLYLLTGESGKYRILEWHEGEISLDVWIENEQFDIYEVQPLPTGEILLICPRSSFRGEGDFDHNGRIYSRDGVFQREILLGDGIQNVQTTEDGKIWTGYFDEGVFGNLGWEKPVGQMGLISWNLAGEKAWEFNPTGDLGYIADCYALNVESDETTWAYYYDSFSLVQIRNFKIESWWEMPIAGSGAFAIDSNGIVLFSGGYDEPDVYKLFELGAEGVVKQRDQMRLVDPEGNAIKKVRAFGRADSLYIADEGRLFQYVVGSVALERTLA